MLRTDAFNVMVLDTAYGAIALAMDSSHIDTVIIGRTVRKRRSGRSHRHREHLRIAHRSRDDIVSKTGWPKRVVQEMTYAFSAELVAILASKLSHAADRIGRIV